MDPRQQHDQLITRRHFFGRSSTGIGVAALATLLNPGQLAGQQSSNPLVGMPGLPHFPPRVKRVIYLFQNGGPTQVDLFDHKPALAKFRGADLPPSVQGGQRLTTMTAGKSQKVCCTRSSCRFPFSSR